MKTARTRRPKLTSSWKLFRRSLGQYRAAWRRYVLVTGLVAGPVALLSMFIRSDDAMSGAFISMALVVMNVALMWSIVHQFRHGFLPKLSDAYYDSSHLFLRFALVSFALVAMLIPLAFGLILLGISLMDTAVTPITSGEFGLLTLVTLVIGLPSFYLMVRYLLALVAVAAHDLRPVAALRTSNRATQGRFWATVARLLALVFYMLLISVPISVVTALLAFGQLTALGIMFFNLLTTVIALPIANLYLFNLYHALTGEKVAFEPAGPSRSEAGRKHAPVGATHAQPSSAPDDSEAVATADPAPAEPAPEQQAEPAKAVHQVKRHNHTGRPRPRLDAMSMRPVRYQPTFGERLR